MFYKHYKIKSGNKQREVVYAAMAGENPENGQREVFYSFVDYTEEVYFDDNIHHEYCRKNLQEELRDYGFIPLPDLNIDHIDGDVEKRVRKAVKKNQRKRDLLLNKAKLIPQLGDEYASSMGATSSDSVIQVVTR